MEIALVSTPQSILTDSQKALVINTLATGVSVCFCMGMGIEIAVICMVANVALSLLSQHEDEIKSWFKWDNKAVQDLKDYWENSLPYFKFHFIALVYRRLFSPKSSGGVQTAVKIIINALQNPYYAAWVIFRTAIVAPVIEEVVFRGFLQEKIRNIQLFIFGKGAADLTVHKTMRIALQALLFGLAHYRADQAGINGFIVLFTGVSGTYNGYLKEKTSTLWCPIAEHAHWNSSTVGAIVGDHLLPYGVMA
ncbi:MAG TPA: CPBP family intramembrane glutamic endopeptidase [Rhabdochlamydiaceae bacterium]|nr:CPBP family intramembrane glutamic endopeptidase [Rhabdochlamydiaceae bacterium]